MTVLSESTPMGMSYGTQDTSRRMKGIVIVVALHAILGYALVSGMARKGLNFIKKPLEAVVIQEVIIPPPPPPPPPKEIKPPEVKAPKVEAPPPPFVPPPDVAPPITSTAPVIMATPKPPPAPIVIAPPPAPVSPPAPAGPKLAAIGVVCPTQVRPEMPRKALQEGTEGVIMAKILIKNGVVHDVTILSGPRVFYAAVKTAIQQYKCVVDGSEVVATQEFNFKLE